MGKWDSVHTRTMGYDDILGDLGKVIQREAIAERDDHLTQIDNLMQERDALRARLTLLEGLASSARRVIAVADAETTIHSEYTCILDLRAWLEELDGQEALAQPQGEV